MRSWAKIQLSPVGSKDISFSFIERMETGIKELESRTFKDLHDYATELSMSIHDRLADARRTGVIGPYPMKPSRIPGPGFDIARVFLNGYYRGEPSRVDVQFFHEDQQLSLPDIKRLPPGNLLTGPGSLPDLILYDERFAKYRREWDGTLQGAVEICESYILAFSGPEALEIEKESSLAVGPNVHIATITPKRGFRLVKDFKAKGAK